MFNPYANKLGQYAIPLAFLVLSILSYQSMDMLTKAWRTVLVDALPLGSLAIAFLLSLQFNRSRFSFAILLLCLLAYTAGSGADKFTQLQHHLTLIAIHLNLLLFSLFKDRNFFSIHGILRGSVIGIQALAIFMLPENLNEKASHIINLELFELPEKAAAAFNLPDIILLMALIIIAIHLTLSLFFLGSIQPTFLGAQIAAIALSSTYADQTFIAILVTACALMICFAVVMDSHDMAYRDELTGLPSRRALNQLLLSLGRKYTIAMMDIDHFKKFNDTHGHDVGDEVLQMVASKIGQVTGGGKPFRYGGEEFTVVFPRKTPDQCEAHLEALRKTIENYQMVVRSKKRSAKDKKDKDSIAKRGKGNSDQKTLSVTISIGLAERTSDLKTAEEVIKGADEALYRAKKGGRNCVSR